MPPEVTMKTYPPERTSNAADALSASRLSRRAVLKWFAATATAPKLPDLGTEALATSNPVTAPPATKGYGTDPDVSGYYKPGDFWPLTLTAAQRESVTTLADIILPADHLGPAASDVRVTDFLDEWLSAPYPIQQKDRATILPGLEWLEEESQKRFQKRFIALSTVQQHTLCDDICWPADAAARFKKAAEFLSVSGRWLPAPTIAPSRVGGRWATSATCR